MTLHISKSVKDLYNKLFMYYTLNIYSVLKDNKFDLFFNEIRG